MQIAQVAGAWASGSMFMGTVALLFLAAQSRSSSPWTGTEPIVACPLPIEPNPCRNLSLDLITPIERLGIVALVAMLFVSLAALLWRTATATWLASDIRARLLWIVVVGLGGLAGWSFAAAVTFAVGFSPVTQVILGYTAGGLPFGLFAAMLLRPWRANVAAIGISVGLVAAGLLMMAGHWPIPQNVFSL